MKLFLAALFCLSTFFLEAQSPKFGHINSLNLIDQLKSSEQADIELKALQELKTKEIEQKQEAFNAEVASYYEDVNAGKLNRLQVEEREAKIQAIQQDLAAMEQKAQNTLMAKRQELLEPILTEVQDAINAVGKEGNYTYIFDESQGVLLFNVESDDITQIVLAKLGIN